MFEYLRSSEFLQKGGLYSENIRYVIAKKKVEVFIIFIFSLFYINLLIKELFLKWISLESTNDLFSKLLKEVSINKITDLSGPAPLFSSSKPILSAGLKSPSTPPKSSSDFGLNYIEIL